MKKTFFLLTFILFIISCKKELTIRSFETIEIESFKIDSTSIRAIHALSKNDAIFAGSKGDIGFTEDGGENWNFTKITYQDTIIPHFRSIAKTKSSLFVLSVANPALLYKIENGATSLVYKEEHPKVFYDAMTFINNNVGIAIGDPIDGCTSIIMTKNQGKTWYKLPCSILPEVSEGEASFAASNTNIAFINNTIWVVTGGEKARVLKSEDLGKSWSIYDTPIVQGNGPQGIYSVDFYDENKGIIIGGDYSNPEENKANVALTEDGGKTWTLVADGVTPNYKSCVQYIPGTKGQEVIAVGKTGTSFSNDGGRNWKDVSLDNYYAIQFVDKNTAWLSGHEKIGKLTLN